VVTLRRITKREAKRLFAEDRIIILCPCKFRPDGPFSLGCPIAPPYWLDRAAWLAKDDPRPLVEKAWDMMYRHWEWANSLSHETGYYAHFYVEEDHK
jgi:hypothetical protein